MIAVPYVSGLGEARLSTPERFATSMDPKILALTAPAWINRPVEVPAARKGPHN